MSERNADHHVTLLVSRAQIDRLVESLAPSVLCDTYGLGPEAQANPLFWQALERRARMEVLRRD
jgi:hypothetical protein